MKIMALKGGVSQITNPAQHTFGSLWRFWFQSQYHVAIGDRWGEITFSPTWQKFPHGYGDIKTGDFDSYLKLVKDKGIKIMAAMANGFEKQFSVALKSLPKDSPALDKTKPESYGIYEKLLKQTVLRYGSVKNDALIDIADYGNHPDNPQAKVSGLNLITYMQLLNEVNGYSGADPAQVLTGKQYAPLYDYWCNAIWSIDPNMKIISAPTARFDETWLNDFTNNSTAIWDARCNISMNVYLFGGCGVWGTCDAIKPENSPLFEQVNNWLKSKNLFGFITEYGCNSTKYSDLGYPDYPGLNAFESQAKLLIDSTKKWEEQSNVIGVTFYKLADDSETRFGPSGIMTRHSTDPKPKPSYPIVKNYFDSQTPPTPTTMKAYYSNNPQRTGQVEITATSVFPVSPFTIEIKDVIGGIEKQLKKDGVIIVARTPESQPPLDVPGTEANGTAKMINAGAGNYELIVWKNNVPSVFTFKVQAATPTPIKKPVTSSYIQEGRVYFQTADSLHSTQVSQA